MMKANLDERSPEEIFNDGGSSVGLTNNLGCVETEGRVLSRFHILDLRFEFERVWLIGVETESIREVIVIETPGASSFSLPLFEETGTSITVAVGYASSLLAQCCVCVEDTVFSTDDP